MTPKVHRPLTQFGLLLLNVGIALLGTSVVEFPFERYTVVSSLRESMFIMDFLTSICAFGLGWLVYHRWRLATAIWLWVLGVCWSAQHALFPPDGQHVLLWEVAATRLGSPDWWAMGNWTTYTVLPLRLIFYSAGAFVCTLVVRKKSTQPAG